MGKLKPQDGGKPKRKTKNKSDKQDAALEAVTVEPSCPYTPGSLTSLLQSAAAAASGATAGTTERKRKSRDDASPAYGKQRKHKTEQSPVEDMGLRKLRELFEKVPQQHPTKAKEARRNSRNNGSLTNGTRPQVTASGPEDSAKARDEDAQAALSFAVAAAAAATAAAADSSNEGPSSAHEETARSSYGQSRGAAPAAEEAAAADKQETQEERQKRTLFVGNLPVREQFRPIELYRHLGLAKAQVESMRLRSVPVAAQFRKCPRAAIARKQFSSTCDQQNAYLVLKDHQLVGDIVKKEFPPFMGRELRLDVAFRGGFSLFDRKRTVCVGGLPRQATEEQLKEALGVFGPVQKTRIVRDRLRRRSLGLGFVCFADRGSATKAILAASCVLLGRPVRLMRALTEEECSKANDARRQQQMTKGRGGKGLSPAMRRILKRKERKLQRRGVWRGVSGRETTECGADEARNQPSGRRQQPQRSQTLREGRDGGRREKMPGRERGRRMVFKRKQQGEGAAGRSHRNVT